MKEEDSAVIKGWLLKANQDYLTWLVLLAGEAKLNDTAAFHAQQAVEKWLKGLLVLNDILPPKTHDILVLLSYIEDYYPELNEPIWAARAETLSRYAVEIRYGDPNTPDQLILPDLMDTGEKLEAFRTFAKEKFEDLWVG